MLELLNIWVFSQYQEKNSFSNLYLLYFKYSKLKQMFKIYFNS